MPSSPYLRADAAVRRAARACWSCSPKPSPIAADPPPGIAVDVDGDIYRVDDDGQLMVVRCDGTSAPLLCEPRVLAQPAGLALDRRGFLYVADPAARARGGARCPTTAACRRSSAAAAPWTR